MIIPEMVKTVLDIPFPPFLEAEGVGTRVRGGSGRVAYLEKCQ